MAPVAADLVVVLDQHVAGFHVAVDDALAVRVVQGAGDLRQQRADAVSSADRTFKATKRPSEGCSARYTVAIPPRATSETSW
jgi:hypothetical protein